METSDSECFESADEDFASDDEVTIKEITQIERLKINNSNTKSIVEKVKIPLEKANATPAANNLNESSKEKEPFSNKLHDTCNKNENSTLTLQSKENVEEENMWNEDEYWGNDINIDNKTTEKDIEENMWNDDEDWEEVSKTNICVKAGKNFVDEKEQKLNQHAWENKCEVTENKNETEAKQETQKKNETTGWTGWGNWGLSSVISTATSLTNQVSSGITSVLESSIGVPNPEELAKIHKQQKLHDKINTSEENNDNTSTTFGLGNLVSGVSHITKLVEETGTKVITGGLDTLETIGKKTMEVLQENDPGLRNKTKFLKIDTNKPILSQVLREAKEKAEYENKIREQKHYEKKANYEMLFDDHQGLVHLEALEMLSKQCDIKLQTLSQSLKGTELTDMQETMDQIKELCELPEEDEEDVSTSDIKERLDKAVEELNISINYMKLLSTWEDIEDWLNKINLNICNENEMHQQAIETLAKLTAIAVEQFHKIGELLLIKEHRSTADEADSLVQ